MTHSDFTHQLVRSLFNNPFKKDHAALRKRKRAATDENAPTDDHVLAALSNTLYYTTRNADPAKKHKSAQRRCNECGHKASFYCVLCSKDGVLPKNVHFLALCGVGANQACYEQHIRKSKQD